MAIGLTATITYTVTTNFPATGNGSMANSVLSDLPGSTCTTGTEPGCSTAVTVLVPALTITKTADTTSVVAGGTVHYTISATNTGHADYPAASLSDPLGGDLDDGVYNSDAITTTGTVSYAADTLAWSGALPIGATVVISYSVAVNLADTGNLILTNRVESTSMGSTCPVGGVDPTCATTTTIFAQTITLTGLTPTFALTGLPNSTVSKDGATIMTVTTNSVGGYKVTVQAANSTMSGTAGNADSIPIERLGVRESGTTLFQALSATTPQTVHQQNSPSAPGGDAISNDYQIQIPFVASDTYSATLDYIVTAQQ